jgi:hypothetical protein
MRGDFSQLFDDDQSVACVLQKQGQILRDGDLNQQALRLWSQLRQLARDIAAIQPPASNNVFSTGPIPSAPAGPTFNLPLATYVDGIRVPLDDNGGPRTLRAKDLKLLLEPPANDSQNENIDAGDYSLFLDVRENAASAVQHNRYVDRALPEMESSVRLVYRPVLRVFPKASIPDDATRAKNTRLEFQSTRDLGNRLYRFEIHHRKAMPDVPALTLKWSADNAGEIYDVQVSSLAINDEAPTVSVKTFQLSPSSAKRIRNLRKGAWIEFLDPPESSLTGPASRADLVQIERVDPDTGQVTLKTDVVVPLHKLPTGTKRRMAFVVWDQETNKSVSDYVPSGDPIDTKQGFKLKIVQGSPSGFWPGDYWTVAVRSGDEGQTLYARLQQASHQKKLADLKVDGGGNITIAFSGRVLDGLVGSESAIGTTPVAIATSSSATPPLKGHVPLKLLQFQLRSPHLQRWVASAELSEVAFLDEDQLRTKVLRSLEVPDSERKLFDDDIGELVRQVRAFANQFSLPSSYDQSLV